MRYYRVIIRNQDGDVLIPNLNGQPGFTPVPYNGNLSTYTSLYPGASPYSQGGSNPAAQLVELDIALTAQDGAVPSSFIRIHGVGLAEIRQASNLNNMQVTVYGGMAKGLPLANYTQSGPLASGQVLQAFGNWVGTDQTLDIFVFSGVSSPSSSTVTGQPGQVIAPATNNAPANIVFQWQPGQPLLSPLINTLQTACPTYAIVGAVHEGLVWAGAAATGFFATLEQLATYLRQKSLSIISGYAPATAQTSYPGVSLTVQNNTITVSDGTTQTTPLAIQFNDLVGQPTYVDNFDVQATCVMRGDMHVGEYVTLPDVLGVTTASSASQYYQPTPGTGAYSSLKNNSIFSGTYRINSVRHVGNSRDPSGTAWITILNLALASTNAVIVPSLPNVWTPLGVGNNKYGFYS